MEDLWLARKCLYLAKYNSLWIRRETDTDKVVLRCCSWAMGKQGRSESGKNFYTFWKTHLCKLFPNYLTITYTNCTPLSSITTLLHSLRNIHLGTSIWEQKLQIRHTVAFFALHFSAIWLVLKRALKSDWLFVLVLLSHWLGKRCDLEYPASKLSVGVTGKILRRCIACGLRSEPREAWGGGERRRPLLL